MANAPVEIGTYAQDQQTGANPYSIATTAGVSAGDAILVAFNIYSGGNPLSSVTDDSGNTYSVIQITTGTPFIVALAYCLSATALASGHTITVTLSGSPTQYLTAVAAKVLGGLASLDVSATNTTSGSSWSAGPTGSTASAVELVLGIFGGYFGGGIGTWTTGSGYTQLDRQIASNGDSNACVFNYLITSGTGTQTATETQSVGSAYGAIVAAFTYPVVATDPYPAGYPMPSRRDWAGYRMHHRERLNRRPSGLYTFGGGA